MTQSAHLHLIVRMLIDLRGMSWNWIMVLLNACLPICVVGQTDSSKTVYPWADISLGVNSPCGIIGGVLGVEVKPWLMPAAGLGFGGLEGMNLSLGLESRALRCGRVDVVPFAYWTFARGGRDDIDESHYYETSSSQLFKLGGSVLVKIGQVHLLVGSGYAWFMTMPTVTGTVPAGAPNSEEDREKEFHDAAVARIGVRIDL